MSQITGYYEVWWLGSRKQGASGRMNLRTNNNKNPDGNGNRQDPDGNKHKRKKGKNRTKKRLMDGCGWAGSMDLTWHTPNTYWKLGRLVLNTGYDGSKSGQASK